MTVPSHPSRTSLEGPNRRGYRSSMNHHARILAAETFGTFVLMLGGPGVAILAGDRVGMVGVALGFGLSLMIMAAVIGPLSGCHINPAVTLAVLVTRRIGITHAALAWIGQVIGAVLGGAVVLGLASGRTGWQRGAFASNSWSGEYAGFWPMVLAEVAMTAILVTVVLVVSSRSFAPGIGGIVVGFTLTLVHLVSIPVDNTSVNPARSLGAALFADSSTHALQELWAFIVFPMVGALVGVVCFLMLDDRRLEDTALARVPGTVAVRNTLDRVADAAVEAVEDTVD